jgi:hypothetical protein
MANPTDINERILFLKVPHDTKTANCINCNDCNTHAVSPRESCKLEHERSEANVPIISRVAKRRITIAAYTILPKTNDIECVKELRGVYFNRQLTCLRLG